MAPGRHCHIAPLRRGADLSEQNLAEMVKCIRLCLDCTDICTAAGNASW
jgi:hypothetical protein